MDLCTSRSPARSQCRSVALAALCFALGVAMPLLAESAAVAQPQTVQAVTPYSAVVVKDGVSLQCRSGSTAYTVKALSNGQILRVDGQADNWLQVEYPAGLSAFVKLDEVAVVEAGKSVKLTRNSRLMAANADGGVNWWQLLEKELPAGTTFAVTKVVKGSDGKEVGYLVPAPKGSHGFVRKDHVRQATQAEIDAATNKLAVEVPKVTAPDLAPIGNTPSVVKPATPDPNKPKEPSIVPPVKDGGTGKPAIPPETKPADANAKPVEGDPKPPVQPEPPKKVVPAKPKLDAEALNTMYTSAMTKSEGEVEIGAVIAEFQKAIDGLDATGDTERLRRQLSLRMDALKLRSQLAESVRQSEVRSSELKQQSQKVSQQVADLERERHFAVVGRLLASSVYDGKKLPLMYRVASSDPSSPRTLAYVVPTDAIVLADNLGKTVGVAGDKKYDEDLKVNVITPTRVEVVTIKAAEPVAAPQPTPAPATPPTDGGTKVEIPVKPAK